MVGQLNKNLKHKNDILLFKITIERAILYVFFKLNFESNQILRYVIIAIRSNRREQKN
jgi:hypothetical protein